MYISVDPRSSTPLYVQVKEQMVLALATGTLQVGDQLPTVRELAARLRINPNTVARVYRELQVEGLLASRQGSGTFVADTARQAGAAEGQAIMRQRLAEIAVLGKTLGLGVEDMEALLREAWSKSLLEVTPDA